MSFTKGPWVRRDTESHAEIDAPGHSTLAMVAGGHDANLIASAPELLEALEEMVRMVEEGGYTPERIMKDAKVAIAKARGQ